MVTGKRCLPINDRKLCSLAEAAEILSISITSIRRLIAKEVFEAVVPNGNRKRGAKILVRVDEIELFAREGEIAVRNARTMAKNKRSKK